MKKITMTLLAKENGMKNCKAPKHQTTHRILLSACATALAVACMVALPQPAHADDVKPPPVPDIIEVPEGNTAFLVGHAVGTQNYVCLQCPNATTPEKMCPDASGFAWTLFTPQATLFDDLDKQVITHFFSPNPFENNSNPGVVAAGRVRATWQHSQDTSTVWAKANASYSNPGFIARGDIPLVLLQVVGNQGEPTDTLSKTTYIQRLNTSGGAAPATGCTSPADIGNQAFMGYTADYFFYKKAAD